MKFAVIYVGNGQETKSSILSNEAGSKAYEMFLSGLGWEVGDTIFYLKTKRALYFPFSFVQVDVETHKGYMGLLRADGSLGKKMLYYASPTCEIAYHVATRMIGADMTQKVRNYCYSLIIL